MRFPVPPHLMMQHGNQQQPPHGHFFPVSSPSEFSLLKLANLNALIFFQPPIHSNMGGPQFLPPDHPMHPQFRNNHTSHLHHQQQQHQMAANQQQQLAANQRKQNRPYQRNEQPGPNQPFFKDNQHLYHNRNNQRYHHQSHGMNGFNESGECDEYAGLMSHREKQWLTNLQLLQHNTNQPYFDDYYYTVYCQRLNKKNENQENKEKKQHNNNGFHRDSKDRDQSQYVFTTKVVYTPLQFENSLGKLQCGSVTAPRKIIDMDVVPNSDPQANPPAQAKEMKKTRQRLLEIEMVSFTCVLFHTIWNSFWPGKI